MVTKWLIACPVWFWTHGSVYIKAQMVWGLRKSYKSCTKRIETYGKRGHKYKIRHWLWKYKNEMYKSKKKKKWVWNK